MTSLDIRFSDDPVFQYMADTVRALSYVFVHHIDLWLKLSDDLAYMMPTLTDITASEFFNYFLMDPSKNPLNDNTLNMIANTFVEAVTETPTLKRYVDLSLNQVAIMWRYCSYLFVPVRLNKESIPNNVKYDTLKHWIVTVFVLPFNVEYASKYANIIKRYTIVKEGKDKLTPENIAQFKSNIKIDWINKIINEYYTSGQFTQEFIRTVMYYLILSSIDILKKYNPRIAEGRAICKEYDGTWLVPFGDKMVDTQLQKTGSLTPLVRLKE